MKNNIVPKILMTTCDNAARFADVAIPIEATHTVNVVPIFSPYKMGIAASSETPPCAYKLCKMPTVALLDCTIAVVMIPSSIPVTGISLNCPLHSKKRVD